MSELGGGWEVGTVRKIGGAVGPPKIIKFGKFGEFVGAVGRAWLQNKPLCPSAGRGKTEVPVRGVHAG